MEKRLVCFFVAVCFAGAAMFGGACGGKSFKSEGVKYKLKKEKVVERSYGGKKKYAKYYYKKPHVKNNKNIYVIGSVDVPGDSSPVMCTKAADLQARVELAQELQSRYENQLQYAAEGFSIDTQTIKQIAAQSTKIEFLQGVYIDNRFWERKIVYRDPESFDKYTCYSRAVMPLSKFEEQAKRLLDEHQKKGEFSPEFMQQVNQQWDNFFKPVDVEDDKEYAVEYLESIQ